MGQTKREEVKLGGDLQLLSRTTVLEKKAESATWHTVNLTKASRRTTSKAPLAEHCIVATRYIR